MNEKELLALAGTQEILGCIDARPQLPEKVAEQLDMKSKVVEDRLEQLAALGLAVRTKKGKYGTARSLGLFTGRVQGFAQGFGFLRPDRGEEDIFIPRDHMNGALSGDIVLASGHEDEDGRWDGEVIRILVHGNPLIVGIISHEAGHALLTPDDRRINVRVRLRRGALQEGDRVVARITDFEAQNGVLEGVVSEVLASKDDPEGPMLSAMARFEIPREYSKAALDAAEKLPQEVTEADMQGRRDLRGEMIFTIDGIDARDFDDAVTLKKLENGNWLLGVHIADVSHYVRPGDAIDRDAYERGTSVYFPGRVSNMLPEQLSAGICSLKPDVDRLAMSVDIEISPEGRMLRHAFYRSVIHSKERLVYADVNMVFAGDEDMCLRYAHIRTMLEDMRTLYETLHAARQARGSVDFEIPEARIKLGDDGEPLDILLHERGIAEKLIEEFMLVANEATAKEGKKRKLPMLYRVHEAPDPERIEELSLFVGGLGYKLEIKGDEVKPKQLQRLLRQVQGKPEEGIISKLTLRSMQKARYDAVPLGHFGLAVRDYCHFTSPIRRYPDLIVHRALADLVAKKKPRPGDGLPAEAEHTSLRERVAMEAERDVDDYLKIRYMQQHIGEEFEGIISGVLKFGFFVELPNTIEGLVHISSLSGYFIFEEKKYRLVGQRDSAKVYALGDTVRVRVKAADPDLRNLDFVVADEESEALLSPEKPKAPKPKQPKKTAGKGRRSRRRR